MCKTKRRLKIYLCLAGVILGGAIAYARTSAGPGISKSLHPELMALLREFREFQKPRLVNGVPDYTPVAMAAQKAGLPEFQKRLAAIDTRGWSVPERVDYELLRAEMNGLEFDHRVLRPWARDPGFYAVIQNSESDVPAREGAEVFG